MEDFPQAEGESPKSSINGSNVGRTDQNSETMWAKKQELFFFVYFDLLLNLIAGYYPPTE